MTPRATLTIVLSSTILAAGITGAAVLVWTRPSPEPKPAVRVAPLVEVVRVERGRVPVTVRSQGPVRPRAEIDLAAEVSGRVVRVSDALVKGGSFRRGEVLVEIDRRDYELAVASALATLARAQREAAEVENRAAVARAEWDALGRGEPDPLVLREPQLAEARRAVEAARAGVERARRDVERTRLVAPFDGVVLDEAVDVGRVVGPGQPLARIAAIDWAEIRLPIPDADLAALGVARDTSRSPGLGPPVVLSARFAGAERRWPGRIVRVEGAVDQATQMVWLVARVDDPYGLRHAAGVPLPIGLFVDAEITAPDIEDAVALPPSAVSADDRVVVVTPAETAELRRVEVLRREADRVVVGKGLADGDRVVVSELRVATPGMRVRVAESSP